MATRLSVSCSPLLRSFALSIVALSIVHVMALSPKSYTHSIGSDGDVQEDTGETLEKVSDVLLENAEELERFMHPRSLPARFPEERLMQKRGFMTYDGVVGRIPQRVAMAPAHDGAVPFTSSLADRASMQQLARQTVQTNHGGISAVAQTNTTAGEASTSDSFLAKLPVPTWSFPLVLIAVALLCFIFMWFCLSTSSFSVFKRSGIYDHEDEDPLHEVWFSAPSSRRS